MMPPGSLGCLTCMHLWQCIRRSRCFLKLVPVINDHELIGEPLMAAHWVDPDFDPGQRAFYYVRVIEIPTPRWTAYDAKFFNVKMPEGTRMTVQDRGYTSPI